MEKTIKVSGTHLKIIIKKVQDKEYYHVHVAAGVRGRYDLTSHITDTWKVNSWEIHDTIQRALALILYRELLGKYPHLYLSSYCDGILKIENGYTRDIVIECGVMDDKPVFKMYSLLHYGRDKVQNLKRRRTLESVYKYISDNEN